MDEEKADDIEDIRKEMSRYLTDPLALKHLYNILCSYIVNANFVSSAEVDGEARELLQNLVLKALSIADKYRGGGIRPWLLSIAQQLLKQRKVARARYRKYELSLSETYSQASTDLSEEEFFDRCTEKLADDEAQREALHMELKDVLAHLSIDDRYIIYYYFYYGLSHNEIAQKLKITPGTARVRSYRILRRLHQWIALNEQKGDDYLA